mgnify:CR=1 FL=1
MPVIKHTHTIKLSPAEAGEIIRQALGLPDDAKVDFTVGSVSTSYDERYDRQGCTSVTLTYDEATELNVTSGKRYSPNTSQFDDRDPNWGR